MELLTQTDASVGLNEKEVVRRIKKYGKNTLAEKSHFLIIKEFLSSFFSPLTLLLLGASIVSAFLGDIVDCIIIFAIILLSGGIGFIQHFRADNAAKRLKHKVALTATVVRDGEEKEIPFSHITIGDIILLSVGDLIPADIKLLEVKELTIDESTLTGESFPVEKKSATLSDLEIKQTTAFAGTHVITGEAKGVVVAIGKNSQLGKLSVNVVDQKPITAFDKDIQKFSTILIRLILVLAGFIFLVNAIFHHNIFSSFLFAVALTVGLTPELMPVIIVVSLARGALKMEEKEVIVKFLPSIQNLGGMDILCMDKTGTITENNILLSSFENILGKKDENVLRLAKLNSFFQSGFKNPLDKALLAHSLAFEEKDYKKVDEIPFNFERKKLSVILKNNAHDLICITKGSPLHVLQNVDSYQVDKKTTKLTTSVLTNLTKKAEEFANNGYRVIAVAQKPIGKKSSYSEKDEVNLTFIGFLVFTDPVKKTVAQTLKTLFSLGVTAKIITGDNTVVTKKICNDAGIPTEYILEGASVAKLSDIQLGEKIEQTTVFSDLTPDQKARIIQLLRHRNHIVGYLGDGINDAPPLKAADIGISVNNGSDIAKDVADVILMRKSLAVLADGIVEGRKTYVNTFKYIMMSLSSNFGNMASVAIASLFLPFLPLLPTQILLINFAYDTSQIAIAADNVDEKLLTKPRKWDMHFLKQFTFTFGPLSSLFDLITFTILLYFLHASIAMFRTGWFIESFVTQTIIILAIRTYLVPFIKSRPSKLLLISTTLTLIAGAIIVFSSIGKYFKFVAVPSIFWIILIAEIFFYFTFVEITKIFFYRKFRP